MSSSRRVATTVALLCVAGVAGVFGARWVSDSLADSVCEFQAAGRTETMTPEQSANASTMSLLAVQRGLPPRAASIAIATAIQESKLQNINYGDADSLGLFQQRPSQGWGSEEEILDPVYASNAFYDALLEVNGWQDGVITEVAQSVQRSAYPAAYADHEWEGRVLASALTGQAPAAVGCDLDAAEGPGDAAALSAELQGLGFQASAGTSAVTVTTSQPTSAWAVASWAVTHAEGREVTSVQVDSQSWNRGQEPLTWQSDPAAAAGPTTVVITLSE